MRSDLGWTWIEADSINTANSFGYPAGALVAAPLIARTGVGPAFRASILLTGVSMSLPGATTSLTVVPHSEGGRRDRRRGRSDQRDDARGRVVPSVVETRPVRSGGGAPIQRFSLSAVALALGVAAAAFHTDPDSAGRVRPGMEGAMGR